MAWLYCPPEAIDMSVQVPVCRDPHWVEQMPGGLPPLTGSEGAQIAWAIVGVWALGFIGRALKKSIRGRT